MALEARTSTLVWAGPWGPGTIGSHRLSACLP